MPIPQTIPELAVLVGQAHRKSRDFYEKWNGRVPAEGTPEAADYQKALDASITDDATLLKAFQTIEGDINDPKRLGEFQSMQLYGSLELDDAAYGRVYQVLGRFYTDFENRNMGTRFRPETGVEAWEQMREAAGTKTTAEIRTCLTPQQYAEFERLYGPEFLWGINIGFQRPK